jgi:hypothetical protein
VGALAAPRLEANVLECVTLVAGGPDRLQRGQGVIAALALADHTPQLVIAHAVAAVEVTDAVRAVIGRAQPGRPLAVRPAGPMAGPREFIPGNLQVCDPRRPTTVVSGGPGRRRWEFMRLPGETVDELSTEETAWRLLQPWGLSTDSARIERHVVYTFQARWADKWRDGRLLLAGDAAHLMPPFAGQGMCSGLRDAANLAWKLDLVLSGHSPEALLDTYTPERSGHVQHAIGTSVALGEVICATDPEAVAQRDAAMLAGGGDPAKVLPPIPPPRLPSGLLHGAAADGDPIGPAGTLTFQGVVSARGRRGRFDEVVGTGFVVAASADPSAVLDRRQRKALACIGARLVHLTAESGTRPAAANAGGDVITAVDIDGQYLTRMNEAGIQAVVVRPDFYLFGVAPALTDLPRLVDDLISQLGLDDRGDISAAAGAAPRLPTPHLEGTP